MSFFGDRYGFALSPSLALTDLSASTRSRGLLAMGASEFETSAPLPLVPLELSKIRDSETTDRYLNDGFSPRSFSNAPVILAVPVFTRPPMLTSHQEDLRNPFSTHIRGRCRWPTLTNYVYSDVVSPLT